MKVYPKNHIKEINERPVANNNLKKIAAIIFVGIVVYYFFFKVVL